MSIRNPILIQAMSFMQNKANSFTVYGIILLLGLTIMGCKKEKMLEPSNADENYLVVHDNPNDPVDHAIFQFYESTGIASFYNDTIFRKQVGDSAGIPRYVYVRLTPGYSPLGSDELRLTLTQAKQQIPSFLSFIKNEVLPKLPKGIFIPSFLIVDSFATVLPRSFMIPADGWEAFQGFNTVVIKNRNVEVMSTEERKMRAVSILAGLAAKNLIASQNARLQKDFYIISRNITRPVINEDIYQSFDISFMYPPPVPATEELGFIHYIIYYDFFDGVEYIYTLPPREEDDLRMYLFAVLYYTPQEFNSKYPDYPSVLDKFNIMREIAKNMGFELPE